MFTIEQIHQAHGKVKSGANFPNYIKNIKMLGVTYYETFVYDGHTNYYDISGTMISSAPKYTTVKVADVSDCDIKTFTHELKQHQQGKTNFMEFIEMCSKTGIYKWVVDITKMTCTYYNKEEIEILVEQIPE